MSPGRFIGPRWRRHLASLLAAGISLAGLAAPAHAAFPSTVAVNDTAFDPACLGFEDSFPEKMYAAAKAEYARLGYSVTGESGSNFTRAALLGRTAKDWSFYVHSHGDYYLNADGKRYSGFREDSGDCSQAVIFSKDILAKRAGRQSNLVVISSCHNGEANTTLPGAFAIGKTKAYGVAWNGPEFYLGYKGSSWDSDEWAYEQAFWDALGTGTAAGIAYDIASAYVYDHDLQADWWGSYWFTGNPGLTGNCPFCS